MIQIDENHISCSFVSIKKHFCLAAVARTTRLPCTSQAASANRTLSNSFWQTERAQMPPPAPDTHRYTWQPGRDTETWPRRCWNREPIWALLPRYALGGRRVLRQDWARRDKFTVVNLLREDTVCILDVLRLNGWPAFWDGGVTADRLPAERQVRLTPRLFLDGLSLCITHFITSH